MHTYIHTYIYTYIHIYIYTYIHIYILTPHTHTHTRAVGKLSSHFEYLENRSRGCDVTWHPVRRDLPVHSWTSNLPWG